MLCWKVSVRIKWDDTWRGGSWHTVRLWLSVVYRLWHPTNNLLGVGSFSMDYKSISMPGKIGHLYEEPTFPFPSSSPEQGLRLSTWKGSTCAGVFTFISSRSCLPYLLFGIGWSQYICGWKGNEAIKEEKAHSTSEPWFALTLSLLSDRGCSMTTESDLSLCSYVAQNWALTSAFQTPWWPHGHTVPRPLPCSGWSGGHLCLCFWWWPSLPA